MYTHITYTSKLNILSGWQNTVGNLIEISWLEKKQSPATFCWYMREKPRVRFHRIRDFEQHYFNSIPPASQKRPLL